LRTFFWVKFVHSDEHWKYALAFFKNADELLFGANSETSDDRYGYDVAGRNKEINQLNAQLIYKYGNQSHFQPIGKVWEMLRVYMLALAATR